ncbi:MAG: hypothetical protein SF053_07210 [Bacteroidia bacterium]|nr:hypothetical protein [Bacteroidia bacterium]
MAISWKRFLILIPGCWVICLSLTAQTEGTAARGWFTRAEMGGTWVQLGALNTALEQKQYGDLSSGIFAFGLASSRHAGRWTLGGNLYNYMLTQVASTRQNVRLGYNYLTLRAGYQVYRRDNEALVLISGGMGAGLSGLKLRDTNRQLAEQHRSLGGLGDLSVSYFAYRDMPDRSGKMLEWGFTAGYMHPLLDSWNMDKLDADNPVIPVSPAGPYFRLSMGMGQWNR